MKKIITLSGDIGGGKTSVAVELAKLTDFEISSTGKIQRTIAEKRGMTTLELNKVSQTDRSVDDEIDSYVIDLGKTSERLLVDSRLAWHFIPDAFKVFLVVDPAVGAQRVFDASRADENNQSLASTLENNRKRQELEDVRFQKLYNIHFRSLDNYDLAIDTSTPCPEAIAATIADCFSKWLAGASFPQRC
ncbi:MAG: AAA family ATPase [Halieaceae bacterium]|nr:AAA family ATPase [Halieaceae bacterium]